MNAPTVPRVYARLRPDPGAVVLAPRGARADVWFDRDDDAAQDHHGCVRYAVEGDVVYGCAELAETQGLRLAARRAYADLFALLGASRSPHLLRLWNYFPGINEIDDASGAERYREFNAGRQQAFIEARRSAFEGSPAACALGTREGPLRVYFVASHVPPIAIENPRQVSAYRYPHAYGPRSPTFSRAALAALPDGRTMLFISGTASIVGHETVHLGDVRRQTVESLTNIDAVRAVAAERAGAVFAHDALGYTVYVRRAADLAAVREVFEAHVGARAAQATLYLQADICRSALLVEIEAHGSVAVPGAAR